MAVIRICRISFTTTDADRLGAFYRQAFGFEAMEVEHHAGTSFARLTGVKDAQARAIPLRLGEETIELLTFTEPGAPYPADVGCDDLRFQHIAIVVADMETAYLRLLGGGPRSPGRHRNDYRRLQALSLRSSFVIRRGIRLNCSRFRPTTRRRAGGTPRIGPARALGSIIPPSSFPARPQASRSTRCWDFPSPGARSIAARSRNSLMLSRVRWSR
jgi:catechol 2,3-dioxygenase-like lactoylglutathione lyase family enzyme